MSYKHANAVRVFSKAKGMPYLIFCELAALMHADGKLIDDQEKLIKMLKVGRSTFKRNIKKLESLGELQRVPSNVRGIATVYRSLLGEVDSLEMHNYFKGSGDLVGGSERTPNSDSEIIGGSDRTVRGSDRTIGGSERTLSGFGENPPKTLELSKTIRTAKPFLKNDSKDKPEGNGMTLDDYLEKFPNNLKLNEGCSCFAIGKRYRFNQSQVQDLLMTFKRANKGTGALSTNWYQEFETWLTDYVMTNGTNG